MTILNLQITEKPRSVLLGFFFFNLFNMTYSDNFHKTDFEYILYRRKVIPGDTHMRCETLYVSPTVRNFFLQILV